MNKKIFYQKIISVFYAALLCVAITGCDGNSGGNENPIEDPFYPTTIYPLSEEILLEMRNDFRQRNPDINTSLNQFGFCAMVTSGGGIWEDATNFTEEEATAAVKEFVARNPEYTGVKNPDGLQFRMIDSSIGYNDAVFWHFRTENQIINDIEVDNTTILLHTKNKKLVSCYGNYFPNIYIPKKFNFNAEQAKSKLLGKEIFHWGIVQVL